MSLQCIILAGGLGTRMRPLTEQMPKALVPVLGTPFADWQLRHIAAQGVKRVVYSVGYRGDMLREFVGDGSRYGLTVAREGLFRPLRRLLPARRHAAGGACMACERPAGLNDRHAQRGPLG